MSITSIHIPSTHSTDNISGQQPKPSSIKNAELFTHVPPSDPRKPVVLISVACTQRETKWGERLGRLYEKTDGVGRKTSNPIVRSTAHFFRKAVEKAAVRYLDTSQEKVGDATLLCKKAAKFLQAERSAAGQVRAMRMLTRHMTQQVEPNAIIIDLNSRMEILNILFSPLPGAAYTPETKHAVADLMVADQVIGSADSKSGVTVASARKRLLLTNYLQWIRSSSDMDSQASRTESVDDHTDDAALRIKHAQNIHDLLIDCDQLDEATITSALDYLSAHGTTQQRQHLINTQIAFGSSKIPQTDVTGYGNAADFMFTKSFYPLDQTTVQAAMEMFDKTDDSTVRLKIACAVLRHQSQTTSEQRQYLTDHVQPLISYQMKVYGVHGSLSDENLGHATTELFANPDFKFDDMTITAAMKVFRDSNDVATLLKIACGILWHPDQTKSQDYQYVLNSVPDLIGPWLKAESISNISSDVSMSQVIVDLLEHGMAPVVEVLRELTTAGEHDTALSVLKKYVSSRWPVIGRDMASIRTLLNLWDKPDSGKLGQLLNDMHGDMNRGDADAFVAAFVSKSWKDIRPDDVEKLKGVAGTLFEMRTINLGLQAYDMAMTLFRNIDRPTLTKVLDHVGELEKSVDDATRDHTSKFISGVWATRNAGGNNA